MLVLQVGKRHEVHQVLFSPDGTTVATPALQTGVYLYPATGGEADLLPLPIPKAGRIAFHPDGKHLYSAHDLLCIVNLTNRTGEKIPFQKWAALKIGVSPDGSYFLVGGVVRPVNTDPQTVTRWTCFPARGPWKPIWQDDFQGSIYSAPMFLPDPKRFMTLERQLNTMPHSVVRSLETGKVLERSSTNYRYSNGYAHSPDGELIAGFRATWIDVNPVNGAWHRTLRNDTKKHVTAVAFHPSGKYLAATSNDATVKIYDTKTWEVARTFTWDIGRMRSIAFSPDGSLAAAGSDAGKIVVWDVDL